MKKELYWPIGITITLLLYISFLVSFLIFARTVPVNLVSEDYYKNGINHQQQIERVKRTKEVYGEIKLNYQLREQRLEIIFPETTFKQAIEGQIHFFRPSDKTLDFSTPLKIDEAGKQALTISDIKNGFWRVNIAWEIGKTEYLSQGVFVK